MLELKAAVLAFTDRLKVAICDVVDKRREFVANVCEAARPVFDHSAPVNPNLELDTSLLRESTKPEVR